MKIFKFVCVAALLVPSAGMAEEKEYKCDRVYYSVSSFIDKAAAEEITPKEMYILFDYSTNIALTSVTGKNYPLKMKGNRASFKLENSNQNNHRFELNYKKLASKGEVTWGIVHSDADFKKSSPGRYECKPIK